MKTYTVDYILGEVIHFLALGEHDEDWLEIILSNMFAKLDRGITIGFFSQEGELRFESMINKKDNPHEPTTKDPYGTTPMRHVPTKIKRHRPTD